MNRLISVVAVAALSLMVVGCASEPAADSGATKPAAQQAKPWWEEPSLQPSLRRLKEDHGIDVAQELSEAPKQTQAFWPPYHGQEGNLSLAAATKSYRDQLRYVYYDEAGAIEMMRQGLTRDIIDERVRILQAIRERSLYVCEVRVLTGKLEGEVVWVTINRHSWHEVQLDTGR